MPARSRSSLKWSMCSWVTSIASAPTAASSSLKTPGSMTSVLPVLLQPDTGVGLLGEFHGPILPWQRVVAVGREPGVGTASLHPPTPEGGWAAGKNQGYASPDAPPKRHAARRKPQAETRERPTRAGPPHSSGVVSSRITRWATAKAEFAAGTPQ